MKKWYLIVIILLITANIHLLYRLSSERQSNQLHLKKKNITGLVERFYKTSLFEIDRNNYFAANPEFANLFKNGDKYVFMFNDNCCSSCIMDCMADLSILGDSIGHENIIIAKWDVDSVRAIKSIEMFDIYNEFIHVYLRKSSKDLVKSEPIMFISDKDFRVKLFLNYELLTHLRDQYYRLVIDHINTRN